MPTPSDAELIEHAVDDIYSKYISEINEKIWSNPEVAWHEKIAHDTICEHFRKSFPDAPALSYNITEHAYGIDTSFVIEYKNMLPSNGSSSSKLRTVVFNAEYDALPHMVLVKGTNPPEYKPAHACGHNLIASASIAAFEACCYALKFSNKEGIVRLLGTPAEESGGGKIKLLEAGAYLAADACMMVHPGPLASDKSIKALAFTRSLASQRLKVEYEGLASHAGFAPWKGKNALDALVSSHVSISMLRQQMLPSCRVSGIVTSGGKAANVIPDHTAAEYSIRAETSTQLDDLRERVNNCFQAGALGSACKANVDNTRKAYWDLISNSILCQLFTKRMNEFGAKTVYELDEITNNPGASTDQGNVSHFCPAMQPAFFIDSGDTVNHMPAFADAAHTEDAFNRAMSCAKGLAGAAYDVLTDGGIAMDVAIEFSKKVLTKAEALAKDHGKKVPTEDQVAQFLESAPESSASDLGSIRTLMSHIPGIYNAHLKPRSQTDRQRKEVSNSMTHTKVLSTFMALDRYSDLVRTT